MDLQAYLARLKIDQVLQPDLPNLKLLQSQHLYNVAFGSIAIQKKERIILDVNHLFKRIILERKDGVCFELNYLMHNLLKELGYKVHIVQGQVCKTNGKFTFEFTHLMNCVEIEGVQYVVDVGFGDGCRNPLKLEVDLVQSHFDGDYKIVRSPNGNKLIIQRTRQGIVQSIIMFNTKAVNIEQFKPIVPYFEYCPYAYSLQMSFINLSTPTGYITLLGTKFITTEFINGETVKQSMELNSEQQLLKIKEMGVCWQDYTPMLLELMLDPTLTDE